MKVLTESFERKFLLAGLLGFGLGLGLVFRA